MKLKSYKIEGRQLTGISEDGTTIKAMVDQRNIIDDYVGITTDFIDGSEYVAIVTPKGEMAIWDAAKGIAVLDECEAVTMVYRKIDALWI